LTDDLCKVSTLARDFYTFYFDANHLLFEEHFPCRAVCPGSLLIDMVVSIISKTNAGSVAFIELEKVKFIEAVYPGKKYLLTIKHDTESDSNGVFYIHTESKKRFTCGRFSIKYKECDAICLTL